MLCILMKILPRPNSKNLKKKLKIKIKKRIKSLKGFKFRTLIDCRTFIDCFWNDITAVKGLWITDCETHNQLFTFSTRWRPSVTPTWLCRACPRKMATCTRGKLPGCRWCCWRRCCRSGYVTGPRSNWNCASASTQVSMTATCVAISESYYDWVLASLCITGPVCARGRVCIVMSN